MFMPFHCFSTRVSDVQKTSLKNLCHANLYQQLAAWWSNSPKNWPEIRTGQVSQLSHKECNFDYKRFNLTKKGFRVTEVHCCLLSVGEIIVEGIPWSIAFYCVKFLQRAVKSTHKHKRSHCRAFSDIINTFWKVTTIDTLHAIPSLQSGCSECFIDESLPFLSG